MTAPAAKPKWLKIASPRRVEAETAPSSPWDPDSDFDELVLYLRGKCWLHVEMLDRNGVFVSIANRRFWLKLTGKKATITWEEVDP